jgi:hypothetical protein
VPISKGYPVTTALLLKSSLFLKEGDQWYAILERIKEIVTWQRRLTDLRMVRGRERGTKDKPS